MLNATKRTLTKDDLEAIQIIVAALPSLSGAKLQRWAGGIEALEELRAEEEKPEKPAS